MRKLTLVLAATASLLGGSAAFSAAQAQPAPQLFSGVYDRAAPPALVQAQFFWAGRNYCWYDGGWRGPGYYWCGYAWRRGYGWGGGYGWRGWGGGHPYAYYHGGDHGRGDWHDHGRGDWHDHGRGDGRDHRDEHRDYHPG